jgi:hypothetical protein
LTLLRHPERRKPQAGGSGGTEGVVLMQPLIDVLAAPLRHIDLDNGALRIESEA